MLETLINLWNTTTEALGFTVIPDRLEHPRHPRVETIRLPAYRQAQSYTCGPIAALMVIHHFHPAVKAKRVFGLANAGPDTGTSPYRLMRALRACRVRVGESTGLQWNDIVKAIDRGKPIITVVNTNNPGINHWVVLYGYGSRPNRVYLAANGLPVVGRREYAWSEFKRYWWTEPGYGLVCQKK